MIFGFLAGAAALAECHERDSLQGHRVRTAGRAFGSESGSWSVQIRVFQNP